jgi:hypothetical protein
MCVSLLISFWASWKFASSRFKLFFFLLSSLVSIILFAAVCSLLSVLLQAQGHLILISMRQRIWMAISGIIAMAYVEMWRLPEIIAEQRERLRNRSQ